MFLTFFNLGEYSRDKEKSAKTIQDEDQSRDNDEMEITQNKDQEREMISIEDEDQEWEMTSIEDEDQENGEMETVLSEDEDQQNSDLEVASNEKEKNNKMLPSTKKKSQYNKVIIKIILNNDKLLLH